MATAVILPKLGNSVESSIIVRWIKQPGDLVRTDEPICEIETDKTTLEVVSPASGVLLAHLFRVGDDVPVMTNIAFVGLPGEEVPNVSPLIPAPTSAAHIQPPASSSGSNRTHTIAISPRARTLAKREQLDLAPIQGSGPGGRVIERDVQQALLARPKLTPLARAMVEKGGYIAPVTGSGPDQRVTARDLRIATPLEEPLDATPPTAGAGVVDQAVPIIGIRRVIAERMRNSLQTTAQLTLNSSADARQIQSYRKRLKASPEYLGLREVTINDLILFAVSRTLPQHPALNAIVEDNMIIQYQHVNLGVAVDTARGLLVPVIRHASMLSLQALSAEAARLAKLSQDGRASVADLNGGSFTVTNLGSLGIESFTPILNAPQVAILGVGTITLKPIDHDGEVTFIPHIHLSLTIDHQVIDGAPAARFLQALTQHIAELDLILAV